MKKLLVILLGGLMIFSLFGCGKKYNATYDYKDGYEGAKDSYRAGEKVKLVYGMIASDTDYTFYVDGADYKVSYENGYVIEFTMPKNDVHVHHDAVNSMVKEVNQ